MHIWKINYKKDQIHPHKAWLDNIFDKYNLFNIIAFQFKEWMDTCTIEGKAIKLDYTHPQKTWKGNVLEIFAIQFAFHFNQY
jgi:protein tyrosine phosphatase